MKLDRMWLKRVHWRLICKDRHKDALWQAHEAIQIRLLYIAMGSVRIRHNSHEMATHYMYGHSVDRAGCTWQAKMASIEIKYNDIMRTGPMDLLMITAAQCTSPATVLSFHVCSFCDTHVYVKHSKSVCYRLSEIFVHANFWEKCVWTTLNILLCIFCRSISICTVGSRMTCGTQITL